MADPKVEKAGRSRSSPPKRLPTRALEAEEKELPFRTGVHDDTGKTRDDRLWSMMSAIDMRLTKVEAAQEVLKELGLKVDKITGFVEHHAPHLATKLDLQVTCNELNKEISKRPTIMNMVGVAALFAALLGIPSAPGWIKAWKGLLPKGSSSVVTNLPAASHQAQGQLAPPQEK
jgi:hypothetical protein